MNLMDLFIKIGVDDQATKGIKSVGKAMNDAKKPAEEYRRDVMKLAQTYKNQGMDMSSAMKKAYSEIDKSQYETAENSKRDSKKFFSNWSDAADKINNVASKIGKGLATAAKVGAAAVGAAAAGIATLTKASIDQYAEYEQLVGGVETLFGAGGKSIEEYAESVGKSVGDVQEEYNALMKSQQGVLENADRAFQTAGLSANEYMATVTSFSASLLQSVGGDTEAAMVYADRAITDMSDNANKMGTSMEMIQNAYQGFAKQNFTMLDNLKLGYGGTKSEMERLLKTASEITGLEFDISNFGDIVNAIHIIQGEMGITGTTAKEAGTTIQGSVASMQSAWANLVTGLTDENANLDELIGNLVTTLVGDGTDSNLGVLGNIMPAIERAFGGIGAVIEGVAPIISEQLPAIASDILPSLLSASTTLVNGIVEALPGIVQILIEQVPPLLNSIITTIIEMLPQIVQLGLDLIISLANGIAQSVPTLIPTIVDVILKIVETLTNPETLVSLLDAGIQILLGVVDGLVKAIPQLLEAIPTIIENLLTALLDSIPLLIDAGIQLLTSLVEALPEIIDTIVEVLPEIIDSIITAIIDSVPQIVQAGIDLLVALVQALPEIINTIVASMPEIIDSVITALLDNLPLIIDAGVQLLVALVENTPEIIKGVVEAIPEIMDGLLSAIKEFVPDLADAGLNLIKGLWNGISDAGEWLWEKISGFFDGIVGKIKGFFGIHSPSTLFRDEIGKMMAKGIGVGFDDEYSNVKKGMEDAMSLDDMEISANIHRSGSYGGVRSGNSFGDVNIRIDGARYTDEQSLAQAIAESLQAMTDRKAAVYA